MTARRRILETGCTLCDARCGEDEYELVNLKIEKTHVGTDLVQGVPTVFVNRILCLSCSARLAQDVRDHVRIVIEQMKSRVSS